MRKIIAAALAAAALVPAAAYAQVETPAPTDVITDENAAGTFGGFRVEGNIGWDKQQAFGRNNERLGYGGSAGFDGNLTKQIIVGPEFNYWRPSKGNTVVASDGGVAKEGRDQYGAAVRIGFRAGPDLIVFGKGGYVNQLQRTSYIDAAGAAVRRSSHADGYQVGGGFQFAPNDRFSFVPANVYVSGQYVYANFSNHTVDQHAMAGVGIKFR